MMNRHIREADTLSRHQTGCKSRHISLWLLIFTFVIHQTSAAAIGLTASSDSSALWSVNAASDGATSLPPVRCLPAWRRHRRSCFRSLQLARVPYDEAREKCHQLDPAADLPIVRDTDDAAFVQGLVPRSAEPAPVFLGATDRQREGQFRWHDGSLVTLDHRTWAQDEPTNSSRQNCLLLITQTDGRAGRARFSIGDTSCLTNTSVVVCQMPFPVLALPVRNAVDGINLTQTIQTNGTGCDYPGSVRFGGSCYLYQAEYLPQHEAARLCRDRGYRLASIQSPNENNFIQYLILDVSWLGGRLRGLQWRWSDGQPLLFTRWAAASPYFHQQPDGAGRERCLNMLSSVRSGWVGERQAAGDGYWADNDCRVRWPSVCETPAAG